MQQQEATRRPGIRWRRRLLLAALLPLGLSLQWVATKYPAGVERVYSGTLYPVLRTGLSFLTAWAAFSLGEVLALLAAIWLAAWLLSLTWRILGRRVGLGTALGLLSTDILALAGVGYVGFLLLWGLNYQRLPFAVSAGLEPRPAPASELEQLGTELASDANRLREAVREDSAGVMRLARGFRGTLLRTQAGFSAAAERHPLLAGQGGPPKPLLVSPLLTLMGVTGLYIPLTGEAGVNASVPAPHLPFSASHEVAHQRGFAREDEANYLAYLACRLHPDPDFRYSGVLLASSYALGALNSVAPDASRRIGHTRAPGVRRDLKALVDWAALGRGPVRDLSERVNDAYLRAQGESQGVASYGRMVDLLLAERRSRGGHVGPP